MNSSQATDKELPPLEKILIIGSGGRENSLAWALQRSQGIKKVWISPGNGGTEKIKGCIQLPCSETDQEGLIKICQEKQIDLVVVGPEAPLAAGIADAFRNKGIAVFGPSKEGAQLESSKSWAKELMREGNIPTAKHWTATCKKDALKIIDQLRIPLAVKADGLAAGKGVIVPESIDSTKKAINQIFEDPAIKSEQVVLEEIISGPEVSVFALCDGEKMVLLPPAQDHKRLNEGDQGPNTGGMGAYAPANLVNQEDLALIKEKILMPTLSGLIRRGIQYRGVIYAGLMLTSSGPKVIEYNCRFGDPECQALMPLMGTELAVVLQACALGSLELAPKLSIEKGCSACVVIASSGYPKSARLNDPITINLQTSKNLQVFHSGTKCNSKGEVVTSGGRVLSIVGQGEDFNEAFSITYKGINRVHFDGMNYRCDIGHQVRDF